MLSLTNLWLVVPVFGADTGSLPLASCKQSEQLTEFVPFSTIQLSISQLRANLTTTQTK